MLQDLDTEFMSGVFVGAVQLCYVIKVSVIKSYEIPP